MFITIEDETGITNLVVWQKVFAQYWRVILSSSMIAVRGRVQREGEVVHLVVHRIVDLSRDLASVGQRDVAALLPDGRGSELHQDSPTPDPRGQPPKGPLTCGMAVPDPHIDPIRVKTRDFR